MRRKPFLCALTLWLAFALHPSDSMFSFHNKKRCIEGIVTGELIIQEGETLPQIISRRYIPKSRKLNYLMTVKSSEDTYMISVLGTGQELIEFDRKINPGDKISIIPNWYYQNPVGIKESLLRGCRSKVGYIPHYYITKR